MKKQYTRKQIQEAIAYWESELRRMDEDRGLGRNILKALGQRDKDDDFEDAVNYANKNNKKAVLQYIDRTIRQVFRDQGDKGELSYSRWTDAAEELVNDFRKWGKKKPGRYQAFFNIVDAEIDRRRSVHQAYMKQVNQITLPDGISSMNYNSQHAALSKIAEAAVKCIESEVCRWRKDNELFDYIIRNALVKGMVAAEKGVSRAEDPFKRNDAFMQYCRKSDAYSKMKNQRSGDRLSQEFIYYLEHDRPIAKQEKKEYGGDWNYDPAYASPENNNSPWHRG